MTPISSNNSLLNSYSRFSGPSVKIESSGGIGPKLKSKTESALERYSAEKAVEEQRLKDQYIGQYGQAAYDYMMEQKNLMMEKQKADIEQVKKYGPPSDYQRGLAQAQEQRAASERAQNYRYGLQAGTQGFSWYS